MDAVFHSSTKEIRYPLKLPHLSIILLQERMVPSDSSMVQQYVQQYGSIVQKYGSMDSSTVVCTVVWTGSMVVQYSSMVVLVCTAVWQYGTVVQYNMIYQYYCHIPYNMIQQLRWIRVNTVCCLETGIIKNRLSVLGISLDEHDHTTLLQLE